MQAPLEALQWDPVLISNRDDDHPNLELLWCCWRAACLQVQFWREVRSSRSLSRVEGGEMYSNICLWIMPATMAMIMGVSSQASASISYSKQYQALFSSTAFKASKKLMIEWNFSGQEQATFSILFVGSTIGSQHNSLVCSMYLSLFSYLLCIIIIVTRTLHNDAVLLSFAKYLYAIKV